MTSLLAQVKDNSTVVGNTLLTWIPANHIFKHAQIQLRAPYLLRAGSLALQANRVPLKRILNHNEHVQEAA